MIFRKIFLLIFLTLTFPVVSFSYYDNLVGSDIQKLIGIEPLKTISLDFKNANLSDILKMFSQQSGMNFVSDATLADKKVNVYLENVPVEQALDRILKANGLEYEVLAESNIFIVKAIAAPENNLMTKVYKLKYASVPSSKLIKTFKIEEEDEGGSTGTSSTTNNENSTSGILESLKSLLSEKGKIVEDPRTNSLIVTDLASQFSAIDITIARLDVPVPQVLIEAEMLDVSKNDLDQLGPEWGDSTTGAIMSFSGASRLTKFPFAAKNYWKDLDATADLDKYGSGAPGSVDFSDLKFTLRFLETQTDTKVLARPRILTMNNETAEIKITTQEAIGIQQQATSIGSTTGAEATITAERTETGVSLKVTPQINLTNDEIIMSVRPRVADAKRSALSESFRDPEERGVKSMFRMKDGDTVVVAGLLQTKASNVKKGLPILKDIPILGAAFRSKTQDSTDRELVVFITPHIVREGIDNSSIVAKNAGDMVREQDYVNQRQRSIEQTIAKFEQYGQ